MAKILPKRVVAVIGTGALLLTGAWACSDNHSQTANGKIVLTVGYQPPQDQKEQRATFDQQVADFEKANPDIQVEPSTLVYDGTTYQTQLAAGTLPIVMQTSFTEPPGLIQKGQVADITDAAKQLKLVDSLNPDVLNLVKDSAGRIYGVPIGAYALGMNYNRDLFQKAGLDPNKGPQTWEEVRQDAKQIKDRTGVPGYAVVSSNNCGGWLLTAMTYSFGGRIVNESGKKAIFADTPQMSQALQLIHDMKWVDGSLTDQNLYDCDSIQPDYAAGKIGMSLKSDYIPDTQQFGMKPSTFGASAMPTWNSVPRATLTGGSVAIVSPKATKQQQVAALKYIKYMYLNKYFDQSFAVVQAKAAQADKSVYELPGVSPVNKQQYQKFLSWIQPYNNITIANWQSYLDSLPGTTLVPEPKYDGQQIYAELDTVVQAVLTHENADIGKLLATAQDQANALLARA